MVPANLGSLQPLQSTAHFNRPYNPPVNARYRWLYRETTHPDIRLVLSTRLAARIALQALQVAAELHRRNQRHRPISQFGSSPNLN